MNTYPLIRVKGSNEHVMAGVFGVSILYLLPSWLGNPSSILSFVVVLAFSLIVDVIMNFIRYKRPICAVSAAVTAGILFILTPGIPLWGQLLSVLAALIPGKHLWGGVGKNPVNPALTGAMLASIVFTIREPVFEATWLLLPAVLLSLPFIRFRPFAAISFMAGMAVSLLIKQELSPESLMTSGLFFFGGLIVTDPVTVTPYPLRGSIGGALAGFIALQLGGSVFFMAAAVLIFNLLSAATENWVAEPGLRIRNLRRLEKIAPSGSDGPFLDLVQEAPSRDISDSSAMTCDEILKRIEAHKVYGFGGAAFPAAQKIRTVIESTQKHKHLVINGVECDPGLIHDHWLIRQSLAEIFKGAAVLKHCVPFETASLAIKNDEGLQGDSWVKIVKVPDIYPIGAEKILIRQVLGKELNIGDVPAKEGILVLNVQTLFSIYEAVYKNKPADTRLLTVADLKAKTFSVAKVRLGTPVKDIVEVAKLGAGQVFVGGGVMQSRLATDEDVLDKNINFVALSGFPRYKESPLCSRCGSCYKQCPSGLKVDRIAELTDNESWQEVRRFHPEGCIQCGNCSRVCLAGRNLSMRVKKAKEHIREHVEE